jgi:hypothetical protein
VCSAVNLLEGFRVAASLSDAEMTYFPGLLLRDRAQEVIALLDAKSAADDQFVL